LQEQLEIEARKLAVELWNNIPEEYRKGHCFSGFWMHIRKVIPEGQLTQVGKETGETAHVERWNVTLSTTPRTFCSQNSSFSKSILMHTICLDLFLHSYNLDRANPPMLTHSHEFNKMLLPELSPLPENLNDALESLNRYEKLCKIRRRSII